MSVLTITAKVMRDANIEQACYDAVVLASITKTNVKFIFNSIPITATPTYPENYDDIATRLARAYEVRKRASNGRDIYTKHV